MCQGQIYEIFRRGGEVEEEQDGGLCNITVCFIMGDISIVVSDLYRDCTR